MGAATAPITAADFLIPGEFAAFRLATSATGHIGGVRIELANREGTTYLGACYQQLPLRVLPPFHPAGECAALLYLLNPAVGLLDGDGQLIELNVTGGARAVVTGQSANRIHPAVSGFATQQWRVRVDSGAILVVLPGPTIPYRGCRYYQNVEIDLTQGAQLIWGDILLPGRYARGEASEQFAFERLLQRVEIRREGRLHYRDRLDWRGPWDAAAMRWHVGGHVATGTLFITGGIERDGWLPTAGVEAAVFPLAHGDTCVRLCGDSSGVIAALVRIALGHAATWTGGNAPWLLGSKHLAPNHWFSMPPTAEDSRC